MNPPKILIVDDIPANLAALEAVLESLEVTLVKAHSGKEALRHILIEEFAAILLDVQMPEIDGIETANLIKKRDRSRHTPILFITANNKDESSAFRGYEGGAVDFIIKPFEPMVLRSKVKVFLDLFNMRQKISEQAEALRQTKEQEYAELAESMPQIVWRADAIGKITYCNKRWFEQAGLPAGTPCEWAQLVPSDERQAFETSIAAARASKGPWHQAQRLGSEKNGYRWHLIRALPQMQSDTVRHWIGTATDIEDAKRVELQLQETNRAKDVFLATLSHELRTPLNAMLGWTQLLKQEGFKEADRARALDAIERNVAAQTRLIEDLLDISRIVADKMQLRRATFDGAQVIDASLDAVRPTAEKKGVTLVVEAARDLPLEGDEQRLQQVVSNLLTNAVKFTPKGGRVWLRAEVKNESIVISVTDTGIGIAREFLPHIFAPFRQADSGPARSSDGLGLGLAIAHRLVTLHGGSLVAQSEGKDRGSTFTVTLARATSGVLARAKPEARPGRQGLEGIHILLVEDSSDSAELMSLLLSQAGAIVQTTSTVAGAKKALSMAIPEVMLSDLNLPDGHGHDLVRHLRERAGGRRAVAIATTAMVSAQDQKQALEAGFDVHLSKPFDLKKLLDLIRQKLQSKADGV